jgi:hypothetical protein
LKSLGPQGPGVRIPLPPQVRGTFLDSALR